jgi:RNA polymerase sigma factor (sigma-70 family)
MTHHFRTTQWTRVLAAQGKSPEARQALSDLCESYYAPVVAFLSRSNQNEDQARELAHEFFSGILARDGIGGADPQRGRFRTYLLGAVKHFLSNNRAAVACEKRGHHIVHEPIHSGTDTSPGLDIPDTSLLPPDDFFDREWALSVLRSGLAALEQEANAAGTDSQFHVLKPWLTGERPDVTQAEAARALGISEGAVRVAIYRLRRRFRELVKAEVSRTVYSASDIEYELRHLLQVLSRPDCD